MRDAGDAVDHGESETATFEILVPDCSQKLGCDSLLDGGRSHACQAGNWGRVFGAAEAYGSLTAVSDDLAARRFAPA